MADVDQLPEISVEKPSATGSQSGQAYQQATPMPATVVGKTLGAADLATLVVNGRQYTTWTSVQMSDVWKTTPRVFIATIAEPGISKAWSTMPIKPGDRAALYLAGLKVCDGYIIRRDTRLNANGHEVIVEGASRDIDLTTTSAKPRQFRGYTLEAIAKGLIKDAGIPVQFLLQNAPAQAQQTIRNFNVAAGESVYRSIERLCRYRGVHLRSDVDGNLVGAALDGKAGSTADLVEGVNILDISASLNDQALMSKVYALGQDQGSDDRFGRNVAEVAAVAENPAARPWRVLRVTMERPGGVQDAQNRADYQLADQLYTSVECNVLVKGWRRPDGQLWQVTDSINVQSPSCFPANGGRMKLGLRSVTFSQSNGGTTTTLGLCLQSALGSPPDPNVKGDAPNILEPEPGAAKPLQPDSGET